MTAAEAVELVRPGVVLVHFLTDGIGFGEPLRTNSLLHARMLEFRRAGHELSLTRDAGVYDVKMLFA